MTIKEIDRVAENSLNLIEFHTRTHTHTCTHTVHVSKNGRGRAPQNSLINKSNEKMRKMIRINFFRILEMNQRLTAIQRAFIQEEWLNPSKNSAFCGILTCPTPILLCLTSLLPLKPTSHNHGGSQRCGSHWQGRKGLELL